MDRDRQGHQRNAEQVGDRRPLGEDDRPMTMAEAGKMLSISENVARRSRQTCHIDGGPFPAATVSSFTRVSSKVRSRQ